MPINIEKYTILKFKNILDINIENRIKKDYTIDFITKIDEYFITGDSKGKLYFYNNSYKIINKIDNLKSSINIAFILNQQKRNSENKNVISLGICSKNKIYLYNLKDLKDIEAKKESQFEDYNSIFEPDNFWIKDEILLEENDFNLILLIKVNNVEKKYFCCFEKKL